jgi:hypothetical protein
MNISHPMTNIILPFTMMLPLETSIPKAIPHYATIQIRSTSDHVRAVVPTYLQGTDGIIRSIASFIGTKYKWVRVLGDIDQVYLNRNKDLYFLFWICSHRLPIPKSFNDLRSPGYQWCHSGVGRRTHCVDTGSQMLPIGQSGLYYTRTGHLGTTEELSRLIRTVSCKGFVTLVQPVLPTIGNHVIITRRPRYWADTSYTGRVVHVDTVPQLDPGIIHWDSVVLDLDSIRPSPSCCSVLYFPDHRHVSGSIDAEWVRIHTTLLQRTTMTIVYTEVPPSSTLHLLEYMFLLQTMYRGERFIGADFTQERHSVMRVAETMLLAGMIQH